MDAITAPVVSGGAGPTSIGTGTVRSASSAVASPLAAATSDAALLLAAGAANASALDEPSAPAFAAVEAKRESAGLKASRDRSSCLCRKAPATCGARRPRSMALMLSRVDDDRTAPRGLPSWKLRIKVGLHEYRNR